MKLLIDTADIRAIERLWKIYPLTGVTTNPTILKKSGQPPFKVLHDIRALIGQEAQLHAQAVSSCPEEVLEEARRIVKELGANTFVKVPAVPWGFQAMKLLAAEGIPVTATAIYTPMQAYLAGMCGAKYAAPYVNRIDNMGCDGIGAAREIHDIFEKNSIPCQVLAASFKNSQQVLELCKHGVGAATLPPEVLEALVKNPAIDSAVQAFVQDFETLAGPGRTMRDCL